MGRSRLLVEFSEFQTWTTQGTLPSKRLPLVFREPGVLTGYRPYGRTWGYYFLSVFKFHNESINIWTHAIATIYLLYKTVIFANDYVTSGDDVFWLLAMDGVCVTLCSFLSAFAHTFHSKSMILHYVCYQCDYIGTSILGLALSIVFLHTSATDGFYGLIHGISLPLYVAIAWYCMLGNSFAKLRYKRPYPKQRRLIQVQCSLTQALVGAYPVSYKLVSCCLDTDCDVTSLNHHWMWIATLLGSAFFFSSHLPEKKYPGSFDFIGQGHQFFHVLISITEVLVFEAVLHDARTQGVRPVDKKGTIIALITYLFGCILVIICLFKYTCRRVKQDEKDV